MTSSSLVSETETGLVMDIIKQRGCQMHESKKRIQGNLLEQKMRTNFSTAKRGEGREESRNPELT
jgi:hypothetical protein